MHSEVKVLSIQQTDRHCRRRPSVVDEAIPYQSFLCEDGRRAYTAALGNQRIMKR